MGQEYEKAERRFLQKEGSKLRSKTKAQARKLGKKTGNYLKSIKRGKVYKYRGDKAVRVYSYAPHAHLIEEGHQVVVAHGNGPQVGTHDGREVGFVKGHHVFEVAAKGFESEFYTDLDDFLSGEVVEKL